jgi:hypothetical protein
MVRNNPVIFFDVGGLFLDGDVIVTMAMLLLAGVITYFAVAALRPRISGLIDNSKPEEREDERVQQILAFAGELSSREQIMYGISDAMKSKLERFYIDNLKARKNIVKTYQTPDKKIHAYAGLSDFAGRASEIINKGENVKTNLEKLGFSVLLLGTARGGAEETTSAQAFTEGLLTNEQGVQKRAIKKPKKTSPQLGISAAAGPSRNADIGFTITNQDFYEDRQLSARDKNVMARAKLRIEGGEVDYKLDGIDEFVVDLPGFGGQGGRGAYRLAFTQSQRTRTLTRIIDPHK